ncbi:hypothetical protein PENTCL1PPCAC_3358 [Pristionchus entomophagus]|uniref:Ankyrin repeat-containing protein n=1 Tax=Pristionchus entomophagus TaxID=358040 RepID=A0AAV5SDP5_9BILA|nr:hypothetical protein PENTCL1PPCAC_3358 [Pristionchus entomophagus]
MQIPPLKMTKAADFAMQHDMIGIVVARHVEVMRILIEKGLDNEELPGVLTSLKDERLLREFADPQSLVEHSSTRFARIDWPVMSLTSLFHLFHRNNSNIRDNPLRKLVYDLSDAMKLTVESLKERHDEEVRMNQMKRDEVLRVSLLDME